MFLNKYDFISSYQKAINQEYGKEYEDADDLERYIALISLITKEAEQLRHKTNEHYRRENRRRVYYFSMEFLIGRLLYNYLLNMGETSIVEEGLQELGTSLNHLIEQERDPGLGNGGLGRLAACFLDSMAKEDVPGFGYGMFYRYGLFKQEIKDGYQVEEPDAWLENGYPWAKERPEKAVKVKFGGHVTGIPSGDRTMFTWEPALEVYAVPNDIPIIGYEAKTVNKLSLWSVKPVRDEFDLNAFNNGDYGRAFAYRSSVEAITQILYPSDATEAGKALRLKQEYLLVAAGIADIIRRYRQYHGDNEWEKFAERIAIHINDTHPALCGPELMRLFLDELGLQWEEAWAIVTKTISYTNHTILPEALEEWPIDMMRNLLPRNYMIIEEIDRRYREALPKDLPDWQGVLTKTAILWDGKVRMANLSVITSYSVNGVSALHSEILKNNLLNTYYQLTPEKFTNVTNGISQRRFLVESNPKLGKLISSTIGSQWLEDAELMRQLGQFSEDKEFLCKLTDIKKENKQRLADYIWRDCGVKVDPDSIFDIQVKRFHAYKRQLLNVLKIMYFYDELLQNPEMEFQPCTFIFAGKAVKSYSFAKSVIKLINSLADVVNQDERVNDKIKVVFLKNFNVSLAQMIYPAADISEQISTAGMEASGTGNMKFMMNGAVTLGTLDGANVEIMEHVGKDNIEIFGLTSEEILEYRKNRSYNVWEEYNQIPELKCIVDQLENGLFRDCGANFWEIHDSLLRNNDYFFVMKDFSSYITAFKNLLEKYKDQEQWAKMSLTNIAKSGYFSSDRAIREYAEKIWKS